MSQKNVQSRIDEIMALTVGDGTSKGNRRVIRKIRKLLNRAETLITIDASVFVPQLNAAYRTRMGKAAPVNVSDKYLKLCQEVIKEWAEIVKGDKDNYSLDSKSTNKIAFTIKEAINRVGNARDNYEFFRKKNAKIVLDLVETKKYNQLFRGRTKTKSGSKRQIFDVGHVYSVTEKGRGGIAAGLLDEALTDDDGTELQEKDFQNPHQYRALKDARANIGIKDEEVLFISGTGGQARVTSRIYLTVESDAGNRTKSSADKTAGEEVKTILTNELRQKWKPSAKEVTNWKGSPSLKDYVGDMIVNTPAKKRAYKKKLATNKTKYKRPNKTKVNKTRKASRSAEFNATRASVQASIITPDIAKRLPKANKQAATTEKGQGHNDFAIAAAGLLAVKRAINKRLPEEVRRNMGRPALRYRTGRFAESTQVESITPSARTLMVKYTYRLNPYETFENTGSKKWPSGYNPKPLISKSIRGLALSMFKITALTTRRV
jgi:hypothetical protein